MKTYQEGDSVSYRNRDYYFLSYDGNDGAIIEDFYHVKKTVYLEYLDKN
jgi:hypothetical protein